MKKHAKTVRQVICKQGLINCKAVLDLKLSKDNEGLPIYVYKCERCGLEENGVTGNRSKQGLSEEARF